jgi:hypothetical protein
METFLLEALAQIFVVLDEFHLAERHLIVDKLSDNIG